MPSPELESPELPLRERAFLSAMLSCAKDSELLVAEACSEAASVSGLPAAAAATFKLVADKSKAHAKAVDDMAKLLGAEYRPGSCGQLAEVSKAYEKLSGELRRRKLDTVKDVADVLRELALYEQSSEDVYNALLARILSERAKRYGVSELLVKLLQAVSEDEVEHMELVERVRELLERRSR